jgi:signal transduction histidine kinase
MNWLRERLAAAQIASLALEAAPDMMVSEKLTQELLDNAGVLAVALRRADSRQLMLRSAKLPVVDLSIDLRRRAKWKNVVDAFSTLVAPAGRTVRIISGARLNSGDFIEIVFDESPLKDAMLAFAIGIFGLSIVISVITAALVYLALNWLLVRPMRHLTRNMVHFSKNPEDASRVIVPSDRRDEIGIAEGELAGMQSELRQMLQQKNRLAALGLAVSKISHDLRNILAHAQLISDRLGVIKDPTVQRVAPKLLGSLDRAIDLCANILKYGQAREAPPRRQLFPLRPLLDEVIEALDLDAHAHVTIINDIAPDLTIDADREHIFRMMLNLNRNALQALKNRESGEVHISGQREDSCTKLMIRDNGPGLPPAAREHLFEAFQGSVNAGGVGLGLAISAELVQAHGGRITLLDDEPGATFVITVPDRSVAAAQALS